MQDRHDRLLRPYSAAADMVYGFTTDAYVHNRPASYGSTKMAERPPVATRQRETLDRPLALCVPIAHCMRAAPTDCGRRVECVR
jgi:hypothetical protein